jgi:tetratricopeptide (TPR) repeat protein
MTEARRTYSIFLSSPGDVQLERNRAQTVVDRLNAEHPGQPVFALVRWEQSYFSASGTFQGQIPNPGEHDIAVFIFWKRLGSELPPEFNRADGTTRTGTEFEFEQARDARERNPAGLPDILVYRKTEKILYSEETVDFERAQKRGLEQFWERWFRSDSGHFIAGFQSVASVNDFERQFERNLRQWLSRRHTSEASWDINTQGSPYRGLVPYEEDHASLFFGREADIARARATFIEAAIGHESGRRGTPFLLILGASGCGKSSFLRAGLVPRMRTAGVPAFLEDGSDEISAFKTLVVTPRELGEDLCLGLANSLYGSSNADPARLGALHQLAAGDYPAAAAFATLAADSPESAALPISRALDRAAAESLDPATGLASHNRLGLLVAIDQFEELFTLAEPNRRAFVRLLTALTATGRIWVTGTMRNDFYDRLREDVDLNALSKCGRLYDLAPPGLADYRDIIRQPARAAGLKFEVSEHRDLAAEIEAEAAGDGALPMVAFMLEQLFQERRRDLLLLATYDRLGGAAGALAQRGDQVLSELPPEVQQTLPRIVRRLVRKSLQDLVPTAVTAPISLFPEGSPERRLIEALAQARLIRTFNTLSGDGSTPVAAVRWSHEALLTRWPRLRDSVDADRRDFETLDRLKNTYSLWQLTPTAQQPERLPVDLALAEATDLIDRWGGDVDEPMRNFVDLARTRARARRRRRRRIVTATIAALSIFATMATIAGILAIKQRNLAVVEQASADQTTRFMVSLFALADPSESRGNAVTVREVLDRGAAEINQRLASDNRVRADLLTAMGEAYSGLGLYDPAKKLLSQADAAESTVSMPAESRVRTLVASGSTAYLAGDYPAAEKFLREAVSQARAKLAPDNVLRSEALVGLAEALSNLDKNDEAEQLCREALSIDRKRGREQATVLARTLDVLGGILYSKGRLADAETAMVEALALHEQASGIRHPLTAQAMDNLAAVLYQSGRYDDATAMYRRAVPIYQAVYGNEHPEVAAMLNNTGRSALMGGHVAEAEPLLRQALAMKEKLRGATNDSLVPTLNSIAMIDEYMNRLPQARAEIARAEQIARLPNHGQLLDQVLLNAADFDLDAGDADAAAAALTESRRLLEAATPIDKNPAEAWRYAIWDSVDSKLLMQRGDSASAHRLSASALPIIEKRWGVNGFHTQLARRRAHQVDQRSGARSN